MSILVYSRTAGYYHESIPTAQQVIRELGYNATFSEETSSFSNYSTLSSYQTIVFLSNSDEDLDTPEQKANLEQYLTDGGGLVGIHSATAALFSTPFYGTAFGAFFSYHPTLQNATFEVVNDTHPSTSALPSRWNFVEEVYNFRSDPRATNVSLLLTVDPYSYEDSNKANAAEIQGTPHPIAWYREGGVDLGNGTVTNGGNATNGTQVQQGIFRMPGRMWYTSLGHTIDVWQDPTFQAHIKGGIDWVLAQNNSISDSSPVSTSASAIPAVNAETSGTPSCAKGTRLGLGGLSAAAVLAGLLM